MSLFKLMLRNVLSRKLTSFLLVLSIGLSSMLLIGVQKIKHSARTSFSHSISGTDLIVGARSGNIQLLMYTVFRQGQPIANMSWDSVLDIAEFKAVEWIVPISLGDSHRGHAVLATTTPYFQRYRYGNKQSLSFHVGRPFQHPFEVVLGAAVAKQFNYQINDTIYLSHGIAKKNLPLHQHNKFKIVGILNTTGTPIDKTVHIPLDGMTALHTPHSDSLTRSPLTSISPLHSSALTPHSVTSCLVGLKSKTSLFYVQQRITNWANEPLMAIIPGVTLSRLWSNIRTIDTSFFLIIILVTLITFIGLLLTLFMTLNQRKRELAILRAMGAHPYQLAFILPNLC